MCIYCVIKNQKIKKKHHHIFRLNEISPTIEGQIIIPLLIVLVVGIFVDSEFRLCLENNTNSIDFEPILEIKMDYVHI
jgi:hypothetical protein